MQAGKQCKAHHFFLLHLVFTADFRMSGKLTVPSWLSSGLLFEPIKEHEKAFHPITMLVYGTAR
jgi:hypothetical protein